GTAQTGFVGEDATFDAHHDRTADQATEHRVQAESALDDMTQHGGYVVELQHDHIQGHCDVGQSLDRYQQVGHRSDTFDTADEHQPQQDGDGQARVVDLEAEGVLQ